MLDPQPADAMVNVRVACRQVAVRLAADIVQAVNCLPLAERTRFRPALLKPHEVAAVPDVVGEQLALQHLGQLSTSLQLPVHLVIDPVAGSFWRILPDDGPSGGLLCASDSGASDTAAAVAAAAGAVEAVGAVYCYLDAVDGTLKVSGLFNDSSSSSSAPVRLRVANDGSWAVGVAFTDAVTTPLQQLRLADFTTAVIMDGCQPAAAAAGAAAGAGAAAYPPLAVAMLQTAAAAPATATTDSSSSSSSYVTRQGASHTCRRLHTTTCSALPQCFAYMDCFQAHDARSAAPGDPALAARLHAALQDRHRGGAFDVLRQYGNLGALLRNMLGWRDDGSSRSSSDSYGEVWCEAQCGVFVVVNENLANLIPAVPVLVGAGGEASDFQGRPLLQRQLGEGRASIVFAANPELHAAAMQLIRTASSAGSSGGGGP